VSARGWWTVAATMLLMPVAHADAAFDADSALAKAHRLLPHVVRDEPGPLWAEFDDAMRAARVLGSKNKFTGLHGLAEQTWLGEKDWFCLRVCH